MRTTIRIDETLYRNAKARAAQTGRTVSEVIEEAVRESLRPGQCDVEVAPLPTFGGSGVLPGVHLTSNTAVRDAIDESVIVDAMR